MMKIDKYLEDYPATTSTDLDPVFKLFKSDVARLADKWRKGQLYLYDYKEITSILYEERALADRDTWKQELSLIAEDMVRVKKSGEEALYLIDENNVLTIVKGEF